jgi:hypothetical protein
MQLLPMRTKGWITLPSKMKLFSPSFGIAPHEGARADIRGEW